MIFAPEMIMSYWSCGQCNIKCGNVAMNKLLSHMKKWWTKVCPKTGLRVSVVIDCFARHTNGKSLCMIEFQGEMLKLIIEYAADIQLKSCITARKSCRERNMLFP